MTLFLKVTCWFSIFHGVIINCGFMLLRNKGNCQTSACFEIENWRETIPFSSDDSFWYCWESDMTLIKWKGHLNYAISPFNSWIVAHDFFKPFLIILHLGNSYAVINPTNANVKGVEKTSVCLVFKTSFKLVCVCKRIKVIMKNVKIIKYFICMFCSLCTNE